MDLILWRHAEAVEDDVSGDDMARTLTPRGEKQAKRMAAWLDRQLPDSSRIWVSPARRTEQTAQALDRKFKLNPAIAPMGTPEQLLELVQWPHAKGVYWWWATNRRWGRRCRNCWACARRSVL